MGGLPQPAGGCRDYEPILWQEHSGSREWGPVLRLDRQCIGLGQSSTNASWECLCLGAVYLVTLLAVLIVQSAQIVEALVR